MDNKVKMTLRIDKPVFDKLAELCGESGLAIKKVLEKWIEYSVEPENKDIMERFYEEILHPCGFRHRQMYALMLTGSGAPYSDRLNFYYNRIKEMDAFFAAFQMSTLQNELLRGIHTAYSEFLNTKRLAGCKAPNTFPPMLVPVELIDEGCHFSGPRSWEWHTLGNDFIARASFIEADNRIVKKGDLYCKAVCLQLKNLEYSINGGPFIPVTKTSESPYDGFWNVGYVDGEWCRMRLHREVWSTKDKDDAISRVAKCEDPELEYASSVFLTI